MARKRYHVADGEGVYWYEDVRAHGCLPILALGLLLDVLGVALMLAVMA